MAKSKQQRELEKFHESQGVKQPLPSQSKSKVCIKCDVKKPLSEFYNAGHSSGKMVGKCKSCYNSNRKTKADLDRLLGQLCCLKTTTVIFQQGTISIKTEGQFYLLPYIHVNDLSFGVKDIDKIENNVITLIGRLA